MKRLSKKAIISIIIAAFLVVSGSIVLTVALINRNNNYFTVNFVTEDGSAVAPIKVEKGKKLEKVPFSEKKDYTFTGWYTAQDKSKSFFGSEPIVQDMTLYASFIKNNDNLKLAKKTNEYLEDCPKNMVMVVRSASEITIENLLSYIEFTTMTGDLPTFRVEKSGNEYTITAVGGFSEGGMFNAKLANGVTLVKMDKGDGGLSPDYSNIKEISFRIHRDNFHEVKAQNGIKKVDASYVRAFSETDYRIPTWLGIVKGDTVLIGNENDANSRYVKIVSVSACDASNSVIKVKDCSVDDVYNEVDVYQQDNNIQNLKLGQDGTEAEIKNALYASEGTREFTARLANAINNSESVKRALAGESITAKADGGTIGGSFADNARITDGDPFSVEGLVPGLTIQVNLGNAENTNYDRGGNPDRNWTGMSIKFVYDVTIKQKINIKASLGITEYLSIAMCAQEKKSGLNLKFNYALDVFTQTDIDFSVELRTASDMDTVNISDEIEGLIKGEGESETGLASQMKDFLDNDRNYIELLKIDLFTTAIGVPTPPIFAVNIDFSFVVKIDFSARLSGKATILDARQIGMYGDTATGVIKTYDNEIFGTGRSSYEIFAVGRLGVRAGLEVTLSISFYGLRALGEIGISGEVGVQFDIYGFMHYTFKNDKFAEDDAGGTIESTLTGGVYFEVSLYMEISLFASSDVFKAKAEVVIFEYQIPLFSLGNKSILVKLDNIDNTNFLMRQEKIKLASIPTLKGTYMDITTGEEESNISTDPEDLSVQFSNPFFKYDFDNNEICLQKQNLGIYEDEYDVSRDDKMVSVDMNVFYRGPSLMFHSGSGANAYPRLGKINLVWADPSIEFSESDIGKAVKATFNYRADGVDYPLATREVLVGKSVGGVDLSQILQKYVVVPNGTVAGIGWDIVPDSATITKDTTFTYTTKRKQALVGFLYNNGKDWTADVKAVNLGETPEIPQLAPNDKLEFKQWNGYPCTNATSREYGNTFSGVKEVKTDTFGFSSIYLTGLNTTANVKSFSGSNQQAMDFIIENVGTAYGGAYYYYADYEYSFVDITFEIVGIDGKPKSFVKQTAFGIAPYPSDYECLSQAGLTLLGWDSLDDNNYDGEVDYDYRQLPVASSMQTYKAVYAKQTLEVFVYGIDGKLIQKFNNEYGEYFPDIVYKQPVVPQTPGEEEYKDVHWEMKYNIEGKDDLYYWSGVKDMVCWYSVSFYAVASHNFLCTFDADGGKVGGEDSVKLSAKAGETLPISGKNGILKWDCVKDDNYKNYKLTGWRDEKGKVYAVGDNVTVTSKKTFTAIYKATDKRYTAKVSTPHGVLLNQKAAHDFSGGYDGYVAFTNDYNNYIPQVANEVDKVWTYASATKTVDGLTASYVYNWTSQPRNYSVTLALDNGEQDTTKVLPYGSVYHFDREYYDKAADNTKFYELEGWDINGDNVIDVGALYNDEPKQIIVKSDMTIKAIWRFTTQTRTITIMAVFGEDNIATTKTFTGAVDSIFDKSILDTVAQEYVNGGNTRVFVKWSAKIPDTYKDDIDIVAEYKLKDFTITFNLKDDLSGIVTLYKTVQVEHHSLLQLPIVYGVPEIPEAAKGKNFSGWKMDYDGQYNGEIQAGIQLNHDVIIHGTITTFYVTYSLNGEVYQKDEVLIGETVTKLADIAGNTSWIAADELSSAIIFDGNNFTMPASNVNFVANTDVVSGNLVVGYGQNSSNINTISKSGSDIKNDYFNYYATDGALYIKKSGVTLSGNAKDIIVIIAPAVNIITLKDLNIVSLGNKDIVFSSDILFPDAGHERPVSYNDAIIYSMSADLTIKIDGDVRLHKTSDNGNVIVSAPTKQINNGGVSLQRAYGILKITGVALARATDSLSIIADSSGIDARGDVVICDITLDIISCNASIDVFNSSYDNIQHTDANLTLNNTVFSAKNAAHYNYPKFYASVVARGGLTIIDSKLDVVGSVNCYKKMTIKGKTFGDIVSEYSVALGASNQNVLEPDGSLEISLAKGNALNIKSNSVHSGAIELGTQNAFTLTNTISSVDYVVAEFGNYYTLKTKVGNADINLITFTGKN